MDAMQRVEEQRLRGFVTDVLEKRSVAKADAEVVADVLLTANLCGIDSHGIVRLSHYVDRLENGTLNPKPDIIFEQTSPTTGVIDGDDGLGHLVTFRAYERLAELTKSSGTGAVVIKRSSHFGIAGYYVRRLVEHGFAGLAMTPSDAFLIPFGGTKPFFGTNPLAIGFPRPVVAGEKLAPIVLDMATTEIPFGKIIIAQKEGKPIPKEWGFDAQGKPTSDPDKIVGLHPIAGPKGSGLAMMIDLFCSVLSAQAFGPHINKMYREMEGKRNLGHFLAAWDLSRFRPLDELQADLGAMVSELHEMPPAEGFDRVYYPGEIEGNRITDYTANGIPVDEGVLEDLEALAERLGVEPPAAR